MRYTGDFSERREGTVDVIAAPDVFVNASVALGSAPDHATRRLLGGDAPSKTSRWVLDRTRAMLSQAPGFKAEAVELQLATIERLTQVVETGSHDPGDWSAALLAAAKAAGVKRVLTDHPDLIEAGSADGVEFVGTEAWLIERTVPPPAPGG